MELDREVRAVRGTRARVFTGHSGTATGKHPATGVRAGVHHPHGSPYTPHTPSGAALTPGAPTPASESGT